jgi:hypothetical protein
VNALTSELARKEQTWIVLYMLEPKIKNRKQIILCLLRLHQTREYFYILVRNRVCEIVGSAKPYSSPELNPKRTNWQPHRVDLNVSLAHATLCRSISHSELRVFFSNSTQYHLWITSRVGSCPFLFNSRCDSPLTRLATSHLTLRFPTRRTPPA